MNRLQEKYKNTVVASLTKQFNYTTVMQCPKIEKVVINIGVGEAISNPKVLDEAIGCKVTLRGERMYEFLDKLFNITLPRVRDFHGVSNTAFDGRGNYTLGVKEQIIFPEIQYDKVNKLRGMDIVIVTTANTNEEAKALLKEMGMPFAK